jgi:hypothetical protein
MLAVMDRTRFFFLPFVYPQAVLVSEGECGLKDLAVCFRTCRKCATNSDDDQRNKTNKIRGVHLSKSSSKSRYSLTVNE